MLSLMCVTSPPSDLCVLLVRTVVYVGTFMFFYLGVSLISRFVMMSACVVLMRDFELLESGVYAVCVNLQKGETFLVIAARSASACGVCYKGDVETNPVMQCHQLIKMLGKYVKNAKVYFLM